ncbi:MAG: PASTA domain-containing protein, partial [Solirubrobacterales bacterium]|nr:PASTA domain-containing protein [Solirubrobacterales bacterium]
QASGSAGPLGVAVVPGNRARVVAHIRNQDSIVDNYTLTIHGFPREWYTVLPDTVYLVPYGSAGAYEQEVEIQIHPPKTPEAEARRWELNVAVMSRAHGVEAASAPMTLGIHPYEDYSMRVRPERVSGRRRAKYNVTVANNANALLLLALDARDGDDQCRFEFDRDALELRAGESKAVKLKCRPPKQIWIGRPLERRFDILGASGEGGEKLLKDKAEAKIEGGAIKGMGGKLPKIPGVQAPKVNIPQVGIGPGGKLDVRMPNVRGPQFQGVNLRRPTLGLRALKMPNQAAVPAVSNAPLLPTQAVFRQKPWLPWWMSIVVPLIALLAIAFVMLKPKNVEVPDVVGAETVFEAEKKLISSDLALKETREKATADKPAGSVLAQSPEAGQSVKKGSTVTLEIAVGTSDVTVPELKGKNLADAEKALREAKLSVGTSSVQPPDPKLEILSTIPEAGETVKEGTPVNIFYPDAEAAEKNKKDGKDKDKPGGAGGAAGGGKQTKAGDIPVPKIDPPDQKGYGAALQKAGLVPGDTERRLDEAPRGTVVATDPAVGTKIAAGESVNLIVSAGFPRIAFDNDLDILLASSANGKRISPAVAKTSKAEKDPTWSPDGESIVYVADGQLMSADMVQRDRAPTPLRPASEKYADPSFAPTRPSAVLTVSRIKGKDRDLCFGSVKLDEYTPSCISEPGFDVGFAHWSADGKQILAVGTSDKGVGMVQYTSSKAFSANKDNWGKGEFVTKRAVDKGVFDAALSPDGQRLAAVANLDTPVPQLYVTEATDIELKKAKPLPIGGCKVVWLDNRILALVDLGNDCNGNIGKIFRINVDDPTKQTPIAPGGDNPTFQPLSTGG